MTYQAPKYIADLNQRTGNVSVIDLETRQVAAIYRRIEHGDQTFYLAQDAAIAMNKELEGF